MTRGPTWRAKEIFGDAMDLPPGERNAFLMRACAGNEILREEVRSLLIAAAKPGFLEFPESAESESIPRLGDYLVERELDRGAMGIVYIAEDPVLKRKIAIKTLPGHVGQMPDALRRLRREAQLLAAIQHPNIATVFSFEEIDGVHFLTMELVSGATLAGRLADGAISLPDTLSIGRQVATAIAAAHEKGIVHRDLKPSNIKITERGIVKVLDFGIAKDLSQGESAPSGHAPRAAQSPAGEGTVPGTIVGTPGYMSPEQWAGLPVDHRTDVWALGCILYECLTGRRAVRNEDLTRPGDVSGFPSPDLGRLPARTSARMKRLLARCLEISRDGRPDAAWLADELAQIGTRRGRQLGYVAAAAVGALALLWPVLRSQPVAVSVERMNNQEIRGLASDGAVAWVRRFDEPLTSNHAYQMNSKSVTPRTFVTTSGPGDHTGLPIAWGGVNEPVTLELLDQGSGLTLWSRPLAWDRRPISAAGPLSSWWVIDWPRSNSEEPLLAVGLRDGKWYALELQLMSLDGRVLSSYQHPGLLMGCLPVDLDGDGEYSLLLYGANSSARFIRSIVPLETERHIGCLVLLDLEDVRGQAFPYSEGMPEVRDWPGVERAQERSYLLIPPIHPLHTSAIVSVTVTGSSEDKHAIEAATDDGRYFLLDANLRPRSCIVLIEGKAETLVASGAASFFPVLLIHEGRQELIQVPVTGN